MNWTQHWKKTNQTGNTMTSSRIGATTNQRATNEALRTVTENMLMFKNKGTKLPSRLRQKKLLKMRNTPRAAASPASPAAPQSTWRWPGLSGTCPDSLWQVPPAGAEWIRARHQPGAEQCPGNTLQWCRAADPPSGLSPGKQPRWKTSC